MIYFGREHCPAKKHDDDICPICRWTGNAFDPTPSGKKAKSSFHADTCPSPVKLEADSPSNYKKHKGVITYNDRHEEIRRSPYGLAMGRGTKRRRGNAKEIQVKLCVDNEI
jgi:hypothetical protein